MKKITIGGYEYTLEFSIAASLYNECTEEILNGFLAGGMIQNAATEKNVEGALEQFVHSVSNVPQRASVLFHAALLEHHGTDYGDGTIKSIKDSTRLLGQYIREHKDDNDGKGKSFYDVMSEMMELIVEDNFFEMTGLTQMFENLTAEEKKKPGRKKKAGAE